MLRTGCSRNQIQIDLNILGKIKDKKIFFLLSYLFFTLIYVSPAIALIGKLGVVRTKENVRQSQEINNCWQEIELDECILDISSWSQDSDLGNTSVLSLPNVEKLNRFQLLALQNKSRVTSAKLLAMGKELETLIDRFESTLITAEANSSRINLSTGKIIERLLRNSEQAGDKDSSHNLASLESEFSNTDARQALTEARKRLEKFYQLIDRQKYNQAKQEWLQTRRLLWDSYPTDRKIAQAEIRAIWLDRGTIVKAKSESDLAKIFDRLAAAGINTVFFETVNASYTIYPSKIAPEQNPLVKGWDPLKSAVKLAHARGMELHAWVNSITGVDSFKKDGVNSGGG